MSIDRRRLGSRLLHAVHHKDVITISLLYTLSGEIVALESDIHAGYVVLSDVFHLLLFGEPVFEIITTVEVSKAVLMRSRNNNLCKELSIPISMLRETKPSIAKMLHTTLYDVENYYDTTQHKTAYQTQTTGQTIEESSNGYIGRLMCTDNTRAMDIAYRLDLLAHVCTTLMHVARNGGGVHESVWHWNTTLCALVRRALVHTWEKCGLPALLVMAEHVERDLYQTWKVGSTKSVL